MACIIVSIVEKKGLKSKIIPGLEAAVKRQLKGPTTASRRVQYIIGTIQLDVKEVSKSTLKQGATCFQQGHNKAPAYDPVLNDVETHTVESVVHAQ